MERRRGAPATTAYKIHSGGSLEESRERQKLICGSAGKESARNAGDLGLIPGWEDSLEIKSGFSIPYSSIVFLGIFLVDFQSQVFQGLISPVQDLEVGVSDVKLKSLSLRGNDPYLCDLSRLWITVAGIWVFPWQACISASFTHIDAILLPFAVEALGFRSLSEGIISYVFVGFL